MRVNLSMKIMWRLIGLKNRTKKWNLSQQSIFLSRLAELLQEGFDLQEAIEFLKLIYRKEKEALTFIHLKLISGNKLETCLQPLGFSKTICTQLYLAQETGRLNEVMQSCAHYCLQQETQRRKIKKLLVYPMCLLVIVLFLLIGMRELFLPQIEKLTDTGLQENIFVHLIDLFPYYIGGGACMLLMLSIGFVYAYQKQSALVKIVWLNKLPVIRRWIQFYYNGFISRELGYLYESGQNLRTIIQFLESDGIAPFMWELGQLLKNHAQMGHSLSETLATLPFIRREMLLIIEHGEKISQLSIKLRFFSENCFKRLEQDVFYKINLIQPVLFLVIGLLVIFIYLALMLPMLSIMDTII